MSGPYDDIIHLPHHVSETRPQMSMMDRAAQFSPFAALTGHGDAIRETARVTDQQIMLDEAEQAILDTQLRLIAQHLAEGPEVRIMYFQPDERKTGGAYVTAFGTVKKVDARSLSLTDGSVIPMSRIVELGGAFFQSAGNF